MLIGWQGYGSHLNCGLCDVRVRKKRGPEGHEKRFFTLNLSYAADSFDTFII